MQLRGWAGVALAALALTLTVTLAACGGGGDGEGTADGGGARSGDPEQALVDFARCMRKQGVDMPDPQFNRAGGGFTFDIGPNGVDPGDPDFREAEQACRKYSPELNPPAGRE